MPHTAVIPSAALDRVIPIGGLAERTGVKVETIRYYEQVGLLPRPERSYGNQRRYTRRHLERLAFIKHARDLGFSVDSIRTLLNLSDKPDIACDDAHRTAASHLAEVREKIACLKSLEAELQRIANACSGGVPVRDCAVIEALADHSLCRHGHG